MGSTNRKMRVFGNLSPWNAHPFLEKQSTILSPFRLGIVLHGLNCPAVPQEPPSSSLSMPNATHLSYHGRPITDPMRCENRTWFLNPGISQQFLGGCFFKGKTIRLSVLIRCFWVQCKNKKTWFNFETTKKKKTSWVFTSELSPAWLSFRPLHRLSALHP